jgi:hypothetical protein
MLVIRFGCAGASSAFVATMAAAVLVELGDEVEAKQAHDKLMLLFKRFALIRESFGFSPVAVVENLQAIIFLNQQICLP